jgi:acyl carrier protein
MTHQFGLDDLYEILVGKAGLPPEDRVDDLGCTFADAGLDSLAFLALQAELDDRFGFELPDEAGRQTFGEILEAINQRLPQEQLAQEGIG